MRATGRSTSLVGAALALLTLAIYLPAFRFPFITYDDPLYVADNPHVLTGLSWDNLRWAFTTWHTGNWHPVTWLSLMLDAQLFGSNAGAYHVVNVVLHAANTVLLFLALIQLIRDANLWPAAVVAALFAVHPLHVESVAWVSERKDLLSAFFFLLALIFYARYAERPSFSRYATVAVLFICGLLAKPMVVTLPLVLLLLDIWPLRRAAGISPRDERARRGAPSLPPSVASKSFPRLFLEKVPLFVVAAAMSVVTFLAQRSAGATVAMSIYRLPARIGNAFASYARYLGKVFWPYDLVLPYPFAPRLDPTAVALAAALLVGISVIPVTTVRRWPYLLTGWLWFVGMLLPVIGLVQVGPQAMADRYMYLPSIGIFLAATWAFAEARSTLRLSPPVTAAIGGVVIAGLALVTSNQLGYWKNSELLFGHSLAIYPGEIVALRNLATCYAEKHRPRDAIRCLETVLTQIRGDALDHFNYAQALQQTGATAQAAGEYATALDLARDNDKHNVTPSALNNLAWLRATSVDASLRNGAEAVQLAERSCALNDQPTAGQLDTLAAAYAELGDFTRAIECAMRARQVAESNNQSSLSAEIARHVDLFRRGQPLRSD